MKKITGSKMSVLHNSYSEKFDVRKKVSKKLLNPKIKIFNFDEEILNPKYPSKKQYQTERGSGY